MSLLDRLERIFGRLAVPNLSLYLVIGQVFVLFAQMLHVLDPMKLFYAPILVVHGEWWRMLTFMLLVPLPASALGYVGAAFGWYLFYLMGGALEGYWGTFRYNVFLLLSWALTVGLGFFTPFVATTNLYIFGSVFLAFAYLNPDFELLLFFILPMRIKWLALLTWAIYAVNFIMGDLALRMQIAAPVATFLLFFGGDMVRSLRQGRRAAAHRTTRAREEAKPRHVCYVCGKTDLTNPEMDFRYCSKCAGDQCYCPEHIHNHEHVVAPENAPR